MAGPGRTMIYVRSHGEGGLTRVLLVKGLTSEQARGTATWIERVDGQLWEIRARYAHDTGGVPVLVEEERSPCPAPSPEARRATRLDDPAAGRADRQADEDG